MSNYKVTKLKKSKSVRFSIICCKFLFVFYIIVSIAALVPLTADNFEPYSTQSVKIFDRNGILLREVLNEKEGRGEWKKINDISPYVEQAFIAAEDKRFYVHPGFDPPAIIRAIYQNVINLRIISGGSTITQQVIRNVYTHPRSLKYKAVEAWYALRLENMFSKAEILEQYMNRVQFGNQIFGIESAARLYFDKPSKNLSLGEAAFLAGLPNAPSLRNPYKNIQRGIQRQQHILLKMKDCNFISEKEYVNAISEPLRIIPIESQFKAPHFVEMVKQEMGKTTSENISEIHTTLDISLQSVVELIVKNHIQNLQFKNVTNAAVVVLENDGSDIRALVGSANYFDSANSGNVNGAVSLRQPGSAIKPFVYALALEAGSTASDFISDVKTAIQTNGGTYFPENYDKKYHGNVTLRTALACSYNISAVITAEKIGVNFIVDKLKESGISSLAHSPDYYGLGLTLGNAEVTLFELTRAFSIFAHQGILHDIKFIKNMKNINGDFLIPQVDLNKSQRIFSEESSYLITDILSDDIARSPAFGDASPLNFSFPCAVKTGTTKDYRDNWTVGYTTKFTVGVWVGNFNGQPMKNVSGVSGAGGIFHDVIVFLNNIQSAKEFIRPNSIVEKELCRESGMLSNPTCTSLIKERFIKGSEPNNMCPVHKMYQAGNVELIQDINHQRIARSKTELKIVYPNSGDVFKIDPILRNEFQTLKIQTNVREEVDMSRLVIDGAASVSLDNEGNYRWQLQKGKHNFKLQLNDKAKASNRVEIIVE